MAEKSWSDLLAEFVPDLAQLSKQDADYMAKDTALPSRIKYLMAMQLDAMTNHPRGVTAYARRAQDAGASVDQIADAVRILRMFGGRPVMATGAEAFQDLKK
jgi:alkylhydroperoxidase/carboxymuconolactone decarboxylase family protein YurZ